MQNKIFPYHKQLSEHFKQQTKTWNWFSDLEYIKDEVDSFKQDLLKNTYRLSGDSDSTTSDDVPENEIKVYQLIEKAKSTLGISKPVVVYQELNSYQTNASVMDVGDEIIVMVSGKLLTMLTEQELLAVFAHELSHIVFYQLDNGDYDITSRIIRSIANDSRSSNEMLETARLYQLYIELFCDRGALQVVKDIHVVIEALVKVATGLDIVSGKNYLKQANEILSQDEQTGKGGSNQHSHPETFIRARALQIEHNQEDDSDDERMISDIIDANWSMNKLDIFKQASVHQTTNTMIQLITKPKWMQTDSILTISRQYFPKFAFASGLALEQLLIDKELEEWFDNVDDTIREYFSYVMLDFCYADSRLDIAPIGHVFAIAEALNFHKTFRQILKKERKMTMKKLDDMIAKAVAEVSQLSESEEESVLVDE